MVKRWLLLLENLLSDILLNFCIRHSDATIVETKFQARMFQEHFNASPLLIRGSHPLPPINLKKQIDPAPVLWIANMVPLKRPELFVQLARACQDVPASFILVAGKSRPEYRSEIRRSAEELTNLTWLDEISLEESNELFARAALYVNTSEYESIPNTFIQAWMRFTPTVSLNVDPDGVIGRFGLGRVSGNMTQLIADVRSLLSNPEERRLMGERARKHAAEYHDLDVAANRLEALFVDLLSQKGIHVDSNG
jgi:glycosyltransferase involved in cell wall biosynthesis